MLSISKERLSLRRFENYGTQYVAILVKEHDPHCEKIVHSYRLLNALKHQKQEYEDEARCKGINGDHTLPHID